MAAWPRSIRTAGPCQLAQRQHSHSPRGSCPAPQPAALQARRPHHQRQQGRLQQPWLKMAAVAAAGPQGPKAGAVTRACVRGAVQGSVWKLSQQHLPAPLRLQRNVRQRPEPQLQQHPLLMPQSWQRSRRQGCHRQCLRGPHQLARWQADLQEWAQSRQQRVQTGLLICLSG